MTTLQNASTQAGEKGGLVTEGATGRAARAGIQPGDVILSVDGTPVERPEQLQQHLAGAG